MNCGFAMDWWSPTEPVRAPGLLCWYPHPCHSGSLVPVPLGGGWP